MAENIKIKTLIFFFILIIISFFSAKKISDFFTFTYHDKSLLIVPEYHALTHGKQAKDRRTITAILLPVQALNDDRYRRAVKKLADCVQQRTEHRPEIVVSPDSPPSGNFISVGIGSHLFYFFRFYNSFFIFHNLFHCFTGHFRYFSTLNSG